MKPRNLLIFLLIATVSLTFALQANDPRPVLSPRPSGPASGPIPIVRTPEYPSPKFVQTDSESKSSETKSDSSASPSSVPSPAGGPIPIIKMPSQPSPHFIEKSADNKLKSTDIQSNSPASTSKPSSPSSGPMPVISTPAPPAPKFTQSNSGSTFHTESFSESTPITTTTRKSWGKKLEESLHLCIIGIVFFFFSFPVLWFNERRKVETDKVIKDGLKQCAEIPHDRNSMEFDGRLVCVSGPLKTDETIFDRDTGISVNDAVKLIRVVEVYQNIETSQSRSERDTFGGGETTTTHYEYHREWSASYVDSSNFKNQSIRNPNKSAWLYDGETFKARNVRLGAFLLNSNQIDRITSSEAMSIPSNFLKVGNDFQPRIQSHSMNGQGAEMFVEGNYIFVRYGGGTMDNVGDMRISYRVVRSKDLTVVSQQAGETFTPFNIRGSKGKKFSNDSEQRRFIENNYEEENDGINVCCPCCPCCLSCACVNSCMKAPNTIDWVYESRMSKVAAFKYQENTNDTITWLLRLLGFFMMYGGIYCFFAPLIELLQALPLLSTLGSIVVAVFAFLVAFPLTLLTIALAWLFYRPLIAIVLFAIVIPFIVIVSKALSGAKDASNAVTPTFF